MRSARRSPRCRVKSTASIRSPASAGPRRSLTRAPRRRRWRSRPARAPRRSKSWMSRTCRSPISPAMRRACGSRSLENCMSREGYILKESDLLPLSLGAALLGTGGGGNPYIGMLRTRELLRKGASVEVLPLEALRDDDYIGSVGGIGAPVVGVEKVEEGEECLRALRGVEETQNVKV